MLRRIGSLLLMTGVAVGVGVGVAIFVGFRPATLPWLLAIGLTKLTLLASGGLMAAGAFCLRLDKREAARKALSARAASLTQRDSQPVNVLPGHRDPGSDKS